MTLGVSPRGALAVCRMCRSRAFMEGRDYVLPDDVAYIFSDVCAHRLILSAKARITETSAADVLAEKAEEDASGEAKHRYVCKVCGYVYEGDELPADYKCPLCGAGAEYFRQEA